MREGLPQIVADLGDPERVQPCKVAGVNLSPRRKISLYQIVAYGGQLNRCDVCGDPHNDGGIRLLSGRRKAASK